MVIWADNRGRFLFAPGALGNAYPYIDRVRLQFRIHAPLLVGEMVSGFLDALSSDDLFQARRGNEVKVRANWLFGGFGKVYPGANGSRATRIDFTLSLNPTRFLQAHDVPNSIEQRRALRDDLRRSLCPPSSLRLRDNLNAARSVTLDRNDNFIAHQNRVHGPIQDWSERTLEYISMVYQLVRAKLIRAANTVLGPSSSQSAFPDWNNVETRIDQIEHYWEFGVDSATQKVLDIQRLFTSVLMNTRASRYRTNALPEMRDVYNSVQVSGTLGHNDITAKVYAKASHVLRYEISFNRSPDTLLRGTRRQYFNRDLLGEDRLRNDLQLFSQEARARTREFWSEFWRHGRQYERPSQQRLSEFLTKVNRATTETGISSSEVLSLLLARGSISPFAGSDRRDNPVLRLTDMGVLIKTRTSSNRNPRYIVTSPYRPVLEAIRTLPVAVLDAQLPTRSMQPLSVEDTAHARVRPRTFARLEIDS